MRAGRKVLLRKFFGIEPALRAEVLRIDLSRLEILPTPTKKRVGLDSSCKLTPRCICHERRLSAKDCRPRFLSECPLRAAFEATMTFVMSADDRSVCGAPLMGDLMRRDVASHAYCDARGRG